MIFYAEHQLNVMLFMCGMCGILAVMTLMAKSLPKATKIILTLMELSAMMLLIFDRFSYIYRGDTTTLGFYMVRISNCVVFILSLVIPFLVTRYINNMLRHDAKIKKPVQLIIADCLFGVGEALVIISQFTGLYYTFDDQNRYQRSPLHVICYAAPLLIVALQEWAIIKNLKKIKTSLGVSMIICISLPTVASVMQIFLYGISLTNMVTAFMVCVFYTYSLSFLNEVAERAKKHEIDYYKNARKKEAALFKETAEALATAIDTKDKYTRGHSTRVAAYSKMIAEAAGFSPEECEQIYFAGLLHDIGKIGVSNDIINKNAKLTNGEYDTVKLHTEMGFQILSSIKQAPYLSVVAHYHHERYDGKGYPAGLSGTDIPEIARLVAVADAYDAMTSARSYSSPLEKSTVRDEIYNGMGTQFDPKYAEIMLKIMDGNEDVFLSI
ncbi:MAG: HD-GYP domain-containing protein [Clostridia bacterium]|nr:HD-GYP domain-containing protein [Clostridia bacterium]